jgi:hypothetical protein
LGSFILRFVVTALGSIRLHFQAPQQPGALQLTGITSTSKLLQWSI